MTLDYRKTFEIEIINEFQSAIHSKMLNYVLNNELDKSDSTNLQTNLLNQLSNMNQINLFKFRCVLRLILFIWIMFFNFMFV